MSRQITKRMSRFIEKITYRGKRLRRRSRTHQKLNPRIVATFVVIPSAILISSSIYPRDMRAEINIPVQSNNNVSSKLTYPVIDPEIIDQMMVYRDLRVIEDVYGYEAYQELSNLYTGTRVPSERYKYEVLESRSNYYDLVSQLSQLNLERSLYSQILAESTENQLTAKVVDLTKSLVESLDREYGKLEEIILNYRITDSEDLRKFIETNQSYNDNWTDLDLLALMIYRENGSEIASDTSRYLDGVVVMNRTVDSYYKGSIYEVLSRPGQFSWYKGEFKFPSRLLKSKDTYGLEIKEMTECYDIALAVLNGRIPESVELPTQTVPSNVVYFAGFTQGSGVYLYESGHYYCYK